MILAQEQITKRGKTSLVGLVLGDFVRAVAPRRGAYQEALSTLLRLPAIWFVRALARFDHSAQHHGVQPAANRFLERYYRGVEVVGHRLVQSGGVLVLANHPGLVDSLALLGASGRSDVRIVLNDSPIFSRLRWLTSRMIPVSERGSRLSAMRQIHEALRRGEMVVLYPAGRIEPDPVNSGAGSPFLPWSAAPEVLHRIALSEGWSFQTQVAVTGGIFPNRVLKNPFSWLHRDQLAKERASIPWILFTGVNRRRRVRLAVTPPETLGAIPDIRARNRSYATPLIEAMKNRGIALFRQDNGATVITSDRATHHLH